MGGTEASSFDAAAGAPLALLVVRKGGCDQRLEAACVAVWSTAKPSWLEPDRALELLDDFMTRPPDNTEPVSVDLEATRSAIAAI